jgi:hypothetical protein
MHIDTLNFKPDDFYIQSHARVPYRFLLDPQTHALATEDA